MLIFSIGIVPVLFLFGYIISLLNVNVDKKYVGECTSTILIEEYGVKRRRKCD